MTFTSRVPLHGRARTAVLLAALVAAGLAIPGSGGAGASAGGGALDPGLSVHGRSPVAVVVQGAAGGARAIVAAVRSLGGRVVADLPIVHGVAARVPARTLPELARVPGVVAVTADRKVQFEQYTYDDTTSASNFVKTSGASQAWAAGRYGAGVSVAVIDTGTTPGNDLAGRVIYGPDLSGENTSTDSYGHGTVMAGIIAGNGADSAGRVGGAYTGVAPKANIVAIKVAGRNGAVDVSTILQAMQWVEAYEDQFGIRVLNLSWGTRSTQNPAVDPLNYAVQRLWRDGIVVVVSAGNAGPQSGTIAKPGDDPVVITVGAFDDKQNVDPLDDSLAAWSSRGPTATGLAKPDVLAPARSLVALRSPGSAVEVENPKALIAPSYIKGSGTSEAAAVTSGLVALMLEARPSLTPDQVKGLLRSTASPIAGAATSGQGAGRLQLAAAMAADPALLPPIASLTPSTGAGSIEASRGGMNVSTDCNGDGVPEVIKGEIDVHCRPWDGAAWTGAAWTGAAWTGAAWTGAAWTGAAWTGAAWTGTAWTSAVYEDDFMTAFWGNRPPASRRVPGEIPEPDTAHVR